jgi:hypothetical protein
VTDETLRRTIGVMGTLLIVVVGATVLLIGSRGGFGGSNASPSPSRVAVASASPSRAPSKRPSASPSPTPTPTPTPKPTAKPTPTPTATPSPTPTPVPIPTASLTFVGLKLSSVGGADSLERIITFTSNGPATIAVQLGTTGDQTPTRVCVRAGTRDLGCKNMTKGTYSAKTTQAKTNWRVTLIGTNAVKSPLVDVGVTFPAVQPSVKIAHARFDGTDLEETNGIQVRFAPRAGGNVRLVASWGGHPFIYEVDTFDDTTGAPGPSYPNQGPSTNVDLSSPVTAKDTWRLVLKNSEAGFGATDLTATVSWP